MSRASEEVVTIRTPWQSRPFRLLTVGMVISAFGSSITPVAIAFAVLSLGGSATQLGLVVAAYAAAEVATVLVGGVLGDRLPRTAVVQGAALASAVTQGVLGLSLVKGWSSIGLVALLSALTGIVGSLSTPSASAMTQQTVPGYLLQRAISIRRLLGNSASVVGFGAGGMLVAAVGPGWAILIDAFTFLVASILLASVSLPSPAAEPGRSDRKSTRLNSSHAGLSRMPSSA